MKRYIAEIGTKWVTGLIVPASSNSIFVADIAGVETISAITRRLRRGEIMPADATMATAKFRHDFAVRYSRTRITAKLVDLAMDLAESHGLRGFDAVQLAAALQLQMERAHESLTFVSADKALNAAAVAEGLAVDDPNLHP